MKKLLLILLVTVTLSCVAFADFKDMPDNWSTAALQTAVDNKLLNGDNGYIYPDRQLTRAEMATVITRAFGCVQKADISRFTDVTADKWYYDEMSLAVGMGAFEGDGNKLRPSDAITREEAFTVIARVLSLTSGKTDSLNAFSDAESVSQWAKPHLNALAEKGYINGSNGRLLPKSKITRAEFAQLMYNAVCMYVTDNVSKNVNGNIMIKSDVTLKDMTVNGDVIVADGVRGAVKLDNVTVNGRLIFRAGNGSKIDGSYALLILVGNGIKVTASADTVVKEQNVIGTASSLTFESKNASGTSSKPTVPSPETPSTPDAPQIVDDAGKWSQWYN